MTKGKRVERKAAMVNQEQFGAAPSSTGGGVPAFAQKHYSLLEIAKMWHMNIKSVRRLFLEEPGVVTVDQSTEGRMSRRRRRLVRVPEPVLERVYSRLSKGR